MRVHGDACGGRNGWAALLLHRAPKDLLGQKRNGLGAIQGLTQAVGLCHLPGNDESEGRVQHEATPGHRGDAEDRLVEAREVFTGPVEADESYFGGKRANMPKANRKELTGWGTVGKTAVAGVKDSETNRVAAQVIPTTDGDTLQTFVRGRPWSTRTSMEPIRGWLPTSKHETVHYSVGEYVRGQAHTQGIESFWSMLKRTHTGVYHKLSPKHLDCYVRDFAGRHNVHGLDTVDQMATVAVGLVGKRLMYRQLIADNGLDSDARS